MNVNMSIYMQKLQVIPVASVDAVATISDEYMKLLSTIRQVDKIFFPKSMEVRSLERRLVG